MASLWFANVGYGRAEVADAIAEQVRTLHAYHCFDPFTNGPADALAERLVALAPVDDPRIFLVSSGLGGRRLRHEAGPGGPHPGRVTPSGRSSSAGRRATTA